MRALLAPAFICASLLGAMPATAATPFAVGTGTGPDLAVTPDGTAHIVWLDPAGPDDRVGYCRVPAGGSACDSASKFLNFPDANETAGGEGTPQVFAPSANNVVIVAACTQCPTGSTATNTYRWNSADNGVTFPTPPMAPVGGLAPNGQAGFLSGGTPLVVSGSQFQALPTSSAPISLGEPGYVFSPAAVANASGSRVVYAGNNLAEVRYRVFEDTSPPPAVADLNDLSMWGSPQALASPEPDNEETHLSSGSQGILLSYVSSSPGEHRVGMRSFDTSSNTFGPPSYVQGSDPIEGNGLNFPHHSQDGAGRIHFVWRTLHDGGRLRYTRSDDGGGTFSTPATLASGESFTNPVVEAGGSGDAGFAAWRNGAAIRAVPIDPVAESGLGGDPGGGDPGGGDPGGGDPGGGGDTAGPAVSGFGIGSSTLTPGAGTTFTFTSDEAGAAVLTIEKRAKGLRVRRAGQTRCVRRTRRRVRRVRRSLARRPAVRRLSGRARKRRIARLLRRRRCARFRKIGEIRQAVTPGSNTIVFTGTVAGRRLRPGRYRATLVITDAAGNVSRTETVLFRVRRR